MSAENREAEYLTVKQCAAEVMVSSWAIWNLCRLAVLPSIRVGATADSGPYRISRAAFEKWKASRVVRPPFVRSISDTSDGSMLIDRVLGRRPKGEARAAKA